MELPKVGSHRRRASAGSHRTLLNEYDVGGGKPIHDCLVEVDQARNPARSPVQSPSVPTNRLKEVHNGLVTSKELLKVTARISLDQHNSTARSLLLALKIELDRAHTRVTKLIQEQKRNQIEIDTQFRRFHSIASELEQEKKLRVQTERLNKKLGKDLSNTKELLAKANEALEGDRRARAILERACDELARGIGGARAEVEELKRRSARVCEEVEREREMLRVADVLREGRVQMKLSEAERLFEEKNAIVNALRREMESYLESRGADEEGNASSSYDKIRELKKHLVKTLPCAYTNENRERIDFEVVKNINACVVAATDNDDDDDDLHSIELDTDDVDKGFKWGGERTGITKKPATKWEFEGSGENLELFGKKDLAEIVSKSWKEIGEEEMERYNMIKDLRDHIALGSLMASSRGSESPSRTELGRDRGVCSMDQNGLACQS